MVWMVIGGAIAAFTIWWGWACTEQQGAKRVIDGVAWVFSIPVLIIGGSSMVAQGYRFFFGFVIRLVGAVCSGLPYFVWVVAAGRREVSPWMFVLFYLIGNTVLLGVISIFAH